MKVRNLGRKSLEEVLAKLDELGLSLSKGEEQAALNNEDHSASKTKEHGGAPGFDRNMEPGVNNGGLEDGKVQKAWQNIKPEKSVIKKSGDSVDQQRKDCDNGDKGKGNPQDCRAPDCNGSKREG